MAFIDMYHRMIKKYKIVVIALWLIIFGFSVWLGPKFISETKLVFEPPSDSPSAQAQELFEKEFSEKTNESNFIILFRSKIEDLAIINQEINDTIKELVSKIPEYTHFEDILTIQDYFTLVDLGYNEVANSLVSIDGKSTIIVVDYTIKNKARIIELREYLEKLVDEVNLSEEKYLVGLTGENALILDIEEGTKNDLAKMDSIVLPIALLVLALVLQSFRLMIIPMLTMGISALSSFMIMLPIARSNVDVISFAPSIMMSCVIAMSIDYSLFLLTRYREEILKEKSVSQSVKLMSEHAGHTIFVSGLTLAICFLGLTFFPMDLLSTMGLGATIAILTTLLVNLTLTPAILLTFGNFFKNFSLSKKIKKLRKREQPEKTKKDMKEIELQNQLNSTWYKIARFATKYAIPIIIVIFLIAIPVSIQVLKLEHTVDTTQVFPRNAESVEVYSYLSQDFNPGTIAPYFLIIDTSVSNAVKNATCYSVSQDLINQLNSSLNLPYNSFKSIFTLANGMPIPWSYARQYLDPNASLYYSAEGQLYRLAFSRYTNQDNSTVIIEIQTPFDPFGNEEFVHQMRNCLDEFKQNRSVAYDYHLIGGITVIVDSIDAVYELFPLMIVITIAVVYILIAVMFRSMFIPLRLLITIGLTLSWIYGLAVLVFELDILDWLFPALEGVNAMYWITPIMAFSILVGLGLDYDIFLLSRISEYRRKGYTEKASIHKGVYRTGSIISAAGIIMTIAFSGLLLSSEMVLNQFGFMLCFAVLVDTFVIRTILVPAIMSLAEKWNWWPGKVPKPEKGDTYVEDELTD